MVQNFASGCSFGVLGPLARIDTHKTAENTVLKCLEYFGITAATIALKDSQAFARKNPQLGGFFFKNF